MNVLILAGGAGVRLWPLSQESLPKPFLRFGSELSFLQKTVQRFLGASYVDEIAIVVNQQCEALVHQQIAELALSKPIKILVELESKGTTIAIAFGCSYFDQKKSKAPILVVPSDHYIAPESLFLEAIAEVEKRLPVDRIALFGVTPTHAERGYGYICVGEKEHEMFYFIERFVEKPSLDQISQMLDQGSVYWNSGMIFFYSQVFWEELSIYNKGKELPNQSIDYALLEHTTKALLYPLSINWSDLGCWDHVYEMFTKDSDQNVKIGTNIGLDTKNSLIISKHRRICTIGVEDLLIIETEKEILIMKKGESQKIKFLSALL